MGVACMENIHEQLDGVNPPDTRVHITVLAMQNTNVRPELLPRLTITLLLVLVEVAYLTLSAALCAYLDARSLWFLFHLRGLCPPEPPPCKHMSRNPVKLSNSYSRAGG